MMYGFLNGFLGEWVGSVVVEIRSLFTFSFLPEKDNFSFKLKHCRFGLWRNSLKFIEIKEMCLDQFLCCLTFFFFYIKDYPLHLLFDNYIFLKT